MRLCSEPIKRLTLELGGKSPSLVFADADLDDAVPSAVWSIFYSAGQSCEARSRVLVEGAIHDEFLERFVEASGRLRVGDPLDPETQVGSLISWSAAEARAPAWRWAAIPMAAAASIRRRCWPTSHQA
jgi:acyl-CoA reductase-like NAD-dependent aldehyde dehydrogenase